MMDRRTANAWNVFVFFKYTGKTKDDILWIKNNIKDCSLDFAYSLIDVAHHVNYELKSGGDKEDLFETFAQDTPDKLVTMVNFINRK